MIRITDTDSGHSYTAGSREQCRGIDAQAYDLALELGQAVAMGQIIAEPVRPTGPTAIRRTVTITRTAERPDRCGFPFERLRCHMVCDSADRAQSWRVQCAVNQAGDVVHLSETESLLAGCLAAASKG
jgi:hypothetical protein